MALQVRLHRSGTVGRCTAVTAGSPADTCPSRLRGGHALFGGRWMEWLVVLLSANCSRALRSISETGRPLSATSDQ
jgi:hypothetical protein